MKESGSFQFGNAQHVGIRSQGTRQLRGDVHRCRSRSNIGLSVTVVFVVIIIISIISIIVIVVIVIIRIVIMDENCGGRGGPLPLP